MNQIGLLTYHSISVGVGPTNISPDLFQAQMKTLAELNYQVLTLEEFRRWYYGELEIASRSVVITFDDGFLDFANAAYPVLEKYGWTATVFLPAGNVGGTDSWEKHSERQLMSWDDVKYLKKRGIDFGAHGVFHHDLKRVSRSVASQEIQESKRLIEEQLKCPITYFAPPYGRTNSFAQEVIRETYQLSLGTRLGYARQESDLYELPRIEMHYFRNLKRWRDFLTGEAEWYFSGRRLLRSVRNFVTG